MGAMSGLNVLRTPFLVSYLHVICSWHARWQVARVRILPGTVPAVLERLRQWLLSVSSFIDASLRTNARNVIR
jgi:hypothetical protein